MNFPTGSVVNAMANLTHVRSSVTDCLWSASQTDGVSPGTQFTPTERPQKYVTVQTS